MAEQIKEKYNVDMKSLSREIDDLGEIETVSSVIKRVSEFVASATTNFGGKKIVVITHGAFIRSFYEMYVNNSNGVRFTNLLLPLGTTSTNPNLLRWSNSSSVFLPRSLSTCDMYVLPFLKSNRRRFPKRERTKEL